MTDEQKKAMETTPVNIAERKILASEFRFHFWTSLPLAPIPFLAGFREFVLERAHTRCPKWKFKLDELILEIQPRPGERRDRYAMFKCVAGRDGWRMGFRILPAQSGEWLFRATGIDRPPERPEPGASHWLRERDFSGHFAFCDAVLEQLRSGRLDHFNPELLFGYHCLICGKGLTDPASMARRIGPECAGTSSLDPFAPWRPGYLKIGSGGDATPDQRAFDEGPPPTSSDDHDDGKEGGSFP
jgi:hypothetical protein